MWVYPLSFGLVLNEAEIQKIHKQMTKLLFKGFLDLALWNKLTHFCSCLGIIPTTL